MEQEFKLFGIRHLSPASAHHLIQYLNEQQPKCILLEGPADASEILLSIARKDVIPPIALMAYTTELPIETILYPFAEYSPEFQAIRWANQKKIPLRCIDLPARVSLKLHQENKTTQNNEPSQAETLAAQEAQEKKRTYQHYHHSLYQKIADEFQENEYEDYWERHFEHQTNTKIFQAGLALQSQEIRQLVVQAEAESEPWEHAYNLVREAHMRREIKRALDEGYQAKDLVIIVGAYHLMGLNNKLAPMTDEEYAALPSVKTQLTLMPYSYYKLSSRSGYGAGNKAPYYFEIMWQNRQANETEKRAAHYLSQVAIELRKKGNYASSANSIEALRLANALSAMKGGSMPTLNDLHDAIITCLGQGELSPVAEAINRVDIGTAIGSLPEGLSQTPLQEDMNRNLKQLKIEQYKSPVAQELNLDLRENRKVKTEAAAYLDLNRSVFFNRLSLLDIHFASKQERSQDRASWAEKWTLSWSPEIEIEIVESNLKGETIEIAAAYELQEQLITCSSLYEAAKIIHTAHQCELTSGFTSALETLQKLAIEAGNFNETAQATRELSLLIEYGGIRRLNIQALIPLMQQLFLRASLLLFEASNCDNKAAQALAQSIHAMNLVSQEQYELVNDDHWQNSLQKLSEHDDRNPILSGIAFSILLERNQISDEACTKEINRRLSPGIPPELGAGWFEGLSGRNRYTLLSRINIWEELSKYIDSLSEEEFYHSVVFLRRALGSYEPAQKNSIAELLTSLWGSNSEVSAEKLQSELSESEVKKLDEINDFDFDDLY